MFGDWPICMDGPEHNMPIFGPAEPPASNRHFQHECLLLKQEVSYLQHDCLFFKQEFSHFQQDIFCEQEISYFQHDCLLL